MLTARATALSGATKIQSIWHIHLHGGVLMRIINVDELQTLPAVVGPMVTHHHGPVTLKPALSSQLSFCLFSIWLGREEAHQLIFNSLD
mmetsp:Transcript_32069/g.76625  ORF Transcript_32069/g.76625 Transcript_32069/m.76625 type:complete len:89 (+) Transcript_32069:1067-1333(+)